MEFIQTVLDFFLHLDQHLFTMIVDYGVWIYLILFLIIFVETGLVVMPFLPGDSLLFAAGTFCAGVIGASGESAQLNLWLILGLLTVAAILGDTLNYTLGKNIGLKILNWKIGDKQLVNPKYIIETLFKRKYIERKKKNILATTTGIELIGTINDELLKSPELTGEWEFKLRKIERGEYEANQFKDELVTMVTELTRKVINEKAKIISFKDEVLPSEKKEKAVRKSPVIIWEEENCPKCRENKLIKGKTAVGCSNFKGCGFKVPFILFGKKLTEKQIQDVVMKGKSSKLKGFTEHPNQLTEGVIRLGENALAELTAD